MSPFCKLLADFTFWEIICIVWVQLINSVLLAVGRLNDVLDFCDLIIGDLCVELIDGVGCHGGVIDGSE